METRKQKVGVSRFAIAVTGLYLVLAYCFVFAVQPGYGPDEPRHFAYIRRLVEKRALPLQQDGHEVDGAHTLHPPLYYALMTPVYAVASAGGERAAYLAIKCVSPLLLLVALGCFWLTLQRVFPENAFARHFAFAFVALLPLFQLEAAVVNSDVLAVVLGSLLIWLLVRDWEEPPCLRRALMVGLVMAAFANTKATGWTLAPLWAIVLHLRARAHPEWRKGLLRDLAAGYGVLLLLGTWWYVRNQILYGQPVPLAFGPGQIMRPYNLRTGVPLSPLENYTCGYVIHYGRRAMNGLFRSFWSQIEWVAEPYRIPLWRVELVVVIAAAIGGVVSLSRCVRNWRASRELSRDSEAAQDPVAQPSRVPALWIPGTAFAMNWLHTWLIATFVHQGFHEGGRYLMPSVFGAGALMASGLSVIVPKRAQAAVVLALVIALVTFNVHCLIELATVLNPRYVSP